MRPSPRGRTARQGRASDRASSPRKPPALPAVPAAPAPAEHRLRGSCISGRLRSSSCGTTATTSPSTSRRATMIATSPACTRSLSACSCSSWRGRRSERAPGRRADPEGSAADRPAPPASSASAESAAVRGVQHRWAVYQVQLRKRQSQIATRARRSWPPRRLPRSASSAAAADHHKDIVMESRRFRAMGTDIELLVDAEEAGEALAAAEEEFHRLEAILSRFRRSRSSLV